MSSLSPTAGSPLDLFVVAAVLHRPSFVSLESALSAHGWIPESVPIITSCCFRRRLAFDTPVARFEYQPTPFRNLVGVERVERAGAGACLLASPLRALCDLAHERRSVRMNRDYLIGSLRIDTDRLALLRRSDFVALQEELKEGRALRFLMALRKEVER